MGKVIPFPGQGQSRSKRALDGFLDTIRGRLSRWSMSTEKSEEDFLELEEELSNAFDAALRDVFAEALAAADPEGATILLDGQVHRRVLRSKKTFMTSAGPVEVERGLFRAGRGQSVGAMERVVGIVDGFWTPLAARNALWMVTQMVPKKAAEGLARLGAMTPSKASLDRLPKSLSKDWESSRETNEAELIRGLEIPDGTSTLAVLLDGVYAPINGDGSHVEKRRQRHAKGLSARGPNAYREVGCASIGFYGAGTREPPELLGALRFARAPEFKKLGVKAMLEAELRSILTEYPDLEVVFLSDGAPDHWEFFEGLQLEGHFVLDFYHAAEHLNAALGASYGEASVKARRRFAELRHVLLEEPNAVPRIRRALQRLLRTQKLSANSKRIVERASRYFKLHQDRMRYPQMKARQLPIGSGVMEASCKTLVAQRLKLSGQRWSVHGAQAILTPRGWDQSNRFDQAYALLAAKYRSNVTVITPVARSV